jgi:16S rRNA G1207 methylase RsmC
MGPEGLDPTNPGIALLSRQASARRPVLRSDGRGALLVHCGAVPGLGRGVTRLVLDVREVDEPDVVLVPASLEGPAGELRRADFDVALVWPRAHLGMDFTMACLAEAASRIREGGAVLLAARKQKGSRRMADALRELGLDVEKGDRDAGYETWIGVRRGTLNDALVRSWIDERSTIDEPRLGDVPLHAKPGVFSWRALDDGTRALLDVLDERIATRATPPRKVLDLGCGWGPVSVWVARTFPQARLLAIDTNHLAVACTRGNVQRVGAGSRVMVVPSAGLDPAMLRDAPPWVDELASDLDLVLTNPPTHAERHEQERTFQGVARRMTEGGTLVMVVHERYQGTLERLPPSLVPYAMETHDGFVVVAAKRV